MTYRLRLLAKAVIAGGLCGALIGLRPAVPAAADTGVPYNVPYHIPPSPYTLSSTLIASYSGHYTLQSIDRRSRLNDGGIYIERRDARSLLGLVQLYGWDPNGRQTSWFAVLSNFHALAHGVMRIELLDQTGGSLHDQMSVTRTATGDLVGMFHLDGKNYAIRWHKVATH